MRFSKLLATLVTLVTVSTVLSNPVEETNDSNKDGNLLDQVMDYNNICQLHYNSNLTDEEIANYVSSSVDYAVGVEVINHSIFKADKINNIKKEYIEHLTDKLSEADKDFTSNSGLEKRGCPWYSKVGCIAAVGPVAYATCSVLDYNMDECLLNLAGPIGAGICSDLGCI
ncbi:hypothetical protein H8356DRAFT_1704540 [Neocallimastix lanati (nom. inval.)]|nr:hypothetical protein H8356DRAFT_1704540 [Neocallimastix sp. JGI-2020a]